MNAVPTDDLARILSRIGQALGLEPSALPRTIESQVDLWLRNITRIGRAAGAEKLTDPAAVADAVEKLRLSGAASQPEIKSNGLLKAPTQVRAAVDTLIQLAEEYERKAQLLRQIVKDLP